MSYAAILKAAEALGQGQEVSSKMWQPKQGDELIGKLIGVDLYQSAVIQKPCNRYTLETDDGIMTCLLGNATDDKIKHSFKLDVLTLIRFEGKMAIPGGKKDMNVFTIKQYPEIALDVSDSDGPV